MRAVLATARVVHHELGDIADPLRLDHDVGGAIALGFRLDGPGSVGFGFAINMSSEYRFPSRAEPERHTSSVPARDEPLAGTAAFDRDT